jgi:hypothetical protein
MVWRMKKHGKISMKLKMDASESPNEKNIKHKTNSKKTSIWERMYKIHNYHHFTIYRMALDSISSVSESNLKVDSEEFSDESDFGEIIQDFGFEESASETE